MDNDLPFLESIDEHVNMFPHAKHLNEIAANVVKERTKLLMQQNTEVIKSVLTTSAEQGLYTATVYFENGPRVSDGGENTVTIRGVPDGEQKTVAQYFAEELKKAGYKVVVIDTRDEEEHTYSNYVELQITF
jgi:hypothetical protein